MSPLALLALAKEHWQLVAGAVLLAGNILFYNLWQDTKVEYATYAGGVVAVGQQAQADKERIEAEQKQITQETADAWAKNMDYVRTYAAGRVRDNAGRCEVPGVSGGAAGVAEAGSDAVPAPSRVEADCAEATLTANLLQGMYERWQRVK